MKHLRVKTFTSSTFKRFGLFDESFKIYCTNSGPQNIQIFSTIVERVQESENNTTVSLISGTYNKLGYKAFIAYYQDESGLGVSGLASPTSLSVTIDHILHPHYSYALTLGKLALVSNRLPPNTSLLGQQSVSLDQWGMILTISLPTDVYWQTLKKLTPYIIIFWLMLFIILFSLHLGFIGYRQSLTYCLQQAIENETIDVYYQPIVSLNHKKAHNLEALIRWKSPHHGRVSPPTIIEISRRADLLHELTWMVLRKVGQFYRENPSLLEGISTAVNIDRLTLLDDSIIPALKRTLAEYPELKGRLYLEVTETYALTDEELPLMIDKLTEVKNLDIRLSVDDFGTGYSGLDFLRRFPFDTLKIDRIFIADLQEDEFTPQVLSSVVSLAKELNMTIVAEGVERQEQLDIIEPLGIHYIQGYYCSAPLPQEKIIQWIKDKSLQ
ncbi:EAL domain-containing protein [Marinomonas sp.]|nr:EAL domain-containing protein [Marinomonas sp.]